MAGHGHGGGGHGHAPKKSSGGGGGGIESKAIETGMIWAASVFIGLTSLLVYSILGKK